MEKALAVAKVFYDKYKEQGEDMDEMKMHKLMYLAQREFLMDHTDEALFDGNFHGWKFGPVLNCVRKEYRKNKKLFSNIDGTISDESMEIVNKVFKRYGSMSSWKLSTLSHGEFSWKASRAGLKIGENGNRKMKNSAIRIDALKELSERKKRNK